MKPSRFHYYAPKEVNEALLLLDQCRPHARILAGGQSLVPRLNMRLSAPTHLIDINHLSTLSYIDVRDDCLAIGSLTRQRDVEQSTIVKLRYPLMREVIQHIGHTQIRNRGTIAGSLAYADPAAELPALLLCLGGEVIAQTISNQRSIKAEDFFRTAFTTTLEEQELLTEIRFPWLAPHAGWDCLEFSRRSGDKALVGAIAIVNATADGTCSSVQISYFGIAQTPVRGYMVEQILQGKKWDHDRLNTAAEAAKHLVDIEVEDMHATSEYRRALVKEATLRVLIRAWQRCTGAEREIKE